MGFATSWLENKALFPQIFNEAPDSQTGIIVVVPAFNEPGLLSLLDSLGSCIQPECKVEVMIIINAPPDAGKDSILSNSRSVNDIERWKEKNRECFFRLLTFNAGKPDMADWGAGMARKTGMDEALRRFSILDMPQGVIVSLDADCTVAKNYLTSICNEVFRSKEHTGCSIYFEHPLSGNDFPTEIYNHIISYELHLRYYRRALKYSFFPYPFHTVGSAVAVKALNYLKAGGMNRRQAGEDFYFIQKLLPQGGYFTLNSTIVYPSPRISHRVPFGTGPSAARFAGNKEQVFFTYNIEAFTELRSLFGAIDRLSQSNQGEISRYYNMLPPGLLSFIDENEWNSTIYELRHNTGSPSAFRKRFFGWFNMFRIVKYLNYVHDTLFARQAVAESARGLLSLTGDNFSPGDPRDLLIHYRSLDRLE